MLGLRRDATVSPPGAAVEARHFGVLDRHARAQGVSGEADRVRHSLPSSEASRTPASSSCGGSASCPAWASHGAWGDSPPSLRAPPCGRSQEMHPARDLQESMTRYGEPLVDPDAPQLFTELAPGVEVRGSVVGGVEDEAGERFSSSRARMASSTSCWSAGDRGAPRPRNSRAGEIITRAPPMPRSGSERPFSSR